MSCIGLEVAGVILVGLQLFLSAISGEFAWERAAGLAGGEALAEPR